MNGLLIKFFFFLELRNKRPASITTVNATTTKKPIDKTSTLETFHITTNAKDSTISTTTTTISGLSEDNFALEQLLAYRGDLAVKPRPLGVIDSKLFAFDLDGLKSFDVRPGPARRTTAPAFAWANNFPNSSHLGQPEVFNFDNLVPEWVWI